MWKDTKMTLEQYIEHRLRQADIRKKIIIYPYGRYGKITKKILNQKLFINEEYIIDKSFQRNNGKEASIELLQQIEISDYQVVFTCANNKISGEMLETLQEYVEKQQIIEVFPRPTIGRYSYGPLLDTLYGIEKVGAFCSFAEGAAVVGNHDVYISSHEFLSFNGNWEKHPGYIPGLEVARPRYTEKTVIGNDVWIGRNATIIAGVKIGNGVIIGAGAVVTKDIPDYAIAVGVPAKVIRYRYNPEQIAKMNEIAWWNWSDEKIKENQMDFYLEIDKFIEKHGG